MSFKKRSLKKKDIMFGASASDMGFSSNESTCRKCNQFRFMCMCPIEIDSELDILRPGNVRKNENTLDSMAIHASVWKRKVNKEKVKEKNLLSLHSVVKQAQQQQKQKNQNVTKNYASAWKKKVDRQKSIRSLEVQKLKELETNQGKTENSIEIQSPETAAEQRTDEANIVTNPVATQSVPLGMKRKLMLRLSDATHLAGVISNRKKTISNFQKEVEKEYVLKQVIFKNILYHKITSLHICL
jgi:hypothetical protein